MSERARIFEYAAIHQPTPSKNGAGEKKKAKPVLIVDVTRVLAANEQEATILAARAIPDTYLDKLEEVEIVIRPF